VWSGLAVLSETLRTGMTTPVALWYAVTAQASQGRHSDGCAVRLAGSLRHTNWVLVSVCAGIVSVGMGKLSYLPLCPSALLQTTCLPPEPSNGCDVLTAKPMCICVPCLTISYISRFAGMREACRARLTDDILKQNIHCIDRS